MLSMSWFRTHVRLTVTVASIMLLLATTCTIFAGHLSFIHAAVPPTAAGQNGFWAGKEAVELNPVRGEYTIVFMQFTVPTITGSPGDNILIWAGLGGDKNATIPAQVVQAGIGSTIDQYGNQVNTPWWQVSPYNGQQAMPMRTIHAGDTIGVTVSSNWLGSNADVFSITDETTNDTYTTPALTDSTALSDSATAECIVERPLVHANNSPIAQGLADFNYPSSTLTIDNCGVGTNANAQTGIGNVAYHDLTMWDGSTELAGSGVISDDGNSFPVYWFNRAA